MQELMDTEEIALALVEDQGLWLVSRRASGRPFPGCWEFPGGKLLAGESPLAAAVRETLEETGVQVAAVADWGSLSAASTRARIVLHLVRCRKVRGEAQAADPGVSEVAWVETARLSELNMPPANAAILARIIAEEARSLARPESA